jgi:hypothetical protein
MLPLGQLTGGGAVRVASGGDALDDDVAVGDHPVQAVVVSPDRQGTHTQVAHMLGRGR